MGFEFCDSSLWIIEHWTDIWICQCFIQKFTRRGNGFCLLQKLLHRLWGPPSLPIDRYRGHWRGRAVKWSTSMKCADVANERSCLTFRGPCIVIYSYNKSQQGAPFLNFILVKNSKCFGRIYCPSSGALILYSQQLVFVILVMLSRRVLTSLADSQHN